MLAPKSRNSSLARGYTLPIELPKLAPLSPFTAMTPQFDSAQVLSATQSKLSRAEKWSVQIHNGDKNPNEPEPKISRTQSLSNDFYAPYTIQKHQKGRKVLLFIMTQCSGCVATRNKELFDCRSTVHNCEGAVHESHYTPQKRGESRERHEKSKSMSKRFHAPPYWHRIGSIE